MPLVQSSYNPPFPFRNAHLNTIYPNLFRKTTGLQYSRERISTPDGDFLDLDCSKIGSSSLVILVHGLEGSAQSNYIMSMVRMLNNIGMDCLVLNFRGCSGEPNNLLTSYHSGKTDDLHMIVHAKAADYEKLYLVGFSLGGNVSLKYAGEAPQKLPGNLLAVAAVSVPCHLESAAHYMTKTRGRVYLNRLLKALKAKAKERKQTFPNANFTTEEIERVKNFLDFDNLYTAPVHGFKDAVDYWTQSSSRQFLPFIKVPTYLLNAQDDPFLSPQCFPYQEAQQNPNLFLESPKYGGHVGFMNSYSKSAPLYHEIKTVEFFTKF